MKRFLRISGWTVASLVLTVAVLEGGLQLAALVVRGASRTPEAAAPSGGRRILCVGDSNTYGLYVERAEAYPGQLETRWNGRHPESPVQVLNFGYPGTNSSVLRRELPDMLRSLAPDVVVVLVGANDFWTAPVEVEQGGTLGWIRSHSRLLRLVALLVARGDSAPTAPDGLPERRVGEVRHGDEVFELGYEGRRPPVGIVARLRENLTALVHEARSQGVEIVLLTYASPQEFYGKANRRIRRVAGETGTPLVDLANRFAQRCPDPECASLLFEDQHPNPAGYALVAEALEAYLADRSGESAGAQPPSQGRSGASTP